MKWRDFACWACTIVVGSAAAWGAPASAQELAGESGDVGGIPTLQLIEEGYVGGSGRVGYTPPGMEMSGFRVGGMPYGYPGGFGGIAAYDSASLPDVAVAQREQLIATLRQLQDAYCRAAMLDQAIAVRDQIQALESQRNTALPQITDPVTSASQEIPGLPGASGIDDGQPYYLRGRNDESFYAEVTGRSTGSVWGDGIYTDDSDLATAAVHAGVLQDGETKVVKFTILPGEDSYAASSANGVEARTWGSYSGSFRVDAAATRLGYPYTLRGQGLERMQVFVVGSANAGTVWGTDVYTDDSTLDAAAVHAGIVGEGEKAIVTIELLAGRDSYEGTERNGVTSSSYNSWEASYRFLPDDETGPLTPIDEEATPTTESPYALRGQNGQTFIATVTGSTGGSIWGDGVYTDDSDLATAAVHAGALQDGQTGSVRFTILPGQDAYGSSTSNGVTSGSWHSYSGSFRIEGADADEAIGPRESTTVTGSMTGYIWGSGVYTSDSDIGTAAVHAGILQDGETGTVTIERLPGRDAYTGSSSNGVESRDYGSWSESFRFVNDPPNDPPASILELRSYSDER